MKLMVEFDKVWEKYRIKFISQGKVSWDEVWALEDVSFKIHKGEALGIIGHNGAGKTTLLKLTAGMLVPDKGKIIINGKVAVLMELGAGFSPEFTGRENIALNARIYGLDENNLEQLIRRIEEFADLGRFIDAPIKFYSQGMYMRLAFALAIYVEPDILLIDEVLTVGDEEARQKCIRKIIELRNNGVAIILASHDMDMVGKLCDRVVFLNNGRVVSEGPSQNIISHYLQLAGDKKGIASLECGQIRVIFNNGRIYLFCHNNLLTRGMGGYVSFFVPAMNGWFSSLNLLWQVKSKSADMVMAEGQSIEGPLSQVWLLRLSEEGFCWQVEIKDASIKEPHIDLLFMPHYKKWLTLEKDGVFPAFLHKSNWQDLCLGNPSGGLLGIAVEEEIKDFPDMIFEIEESGSGCLRAFNTGCEQESRVVQLDFNGSKFACCNIKLFRDRSIFNAYLKGKKNNFLIKQKEEEENLCLSRTISDGDLRLILDVENKSIRLYYKDKEITKGNGLHSSFFLNRGWYHSYSFDWQLERDKDTLILHLSRKQPEFRQTLRFSFQDSCLFWQVDFIDVESLDFETVKFGLSLSEGYDVFFCGQQQEKFPHNFDWWKDFPLDVPRAELIGLRKKAELPAIVLENKEGLCGIIQSSDVSSSCRILQLSVHKEELLRKHAHSLSGQVSVMEDESSLESYFQQEERKCLARQQEESARVKSSRTISSGPLSLYVEPETKSIRLYYKDKEITKGNGLHSLFYALQKWFHSNDALWDMQKNSEDKLILSLDYGPSLLLQIVTLIWNGDVLGINIDLKIDNPISLANFNVEVELQDQFMNWFTGLERGDFIIRQYIGDIGPIRLKNNRISAVYLEPEKDKDLPGLFLEATSQIDKRIFYMSKCKREAGESLQLSSSLIFPYKEKLLNPGIHNCFNGKIVLGREKNQGIMLYKHRESNPIRFTKNNLRFVFDDGIGRLFWGEKELTSGLGMYTSARVAGIWRDSRQAFWKTVRKDEVAATVIGDWAYIPISQIWQVELSDKNAVYWKVELEVLEEVRLEIQQANMMLSSLYQNWSVPGMTRGEFTDEFTSDYDILPFRFWFGKPGQRKIGAGGNSLPSVLFVSSSGEPSFNALIENTDYLYRARLLQYQKGDAGILSPGKYTYFEGTITVEPCS